MKGHRAINSVRNIIGRPTHHLKVQRRFIVLVGRKGARAILRYETVTITELFATPHSCIR